jgi:hypothetical protein
MDIVGPLPMAQGNFKFAVVAVEYFTKWIEARPVATISSATTENSFDSKPFAGLACLKSSQSIMESSLIARISGSTVAQLERSFALRLCIILSPMGQWKEPTGKSL